MQQQGYLSSVGVSDIGGLGEGWSSLLGSAPDFYTKSQVYSKSEADNRFVTLATEPTEQIISGKKSFTALLTASAGISSTDADFSGYVSASKLYVPSYSGNKVYDLYISNAPVSGETPSGNGGMDETELWSILTDGAGGERIAKAHLPSDAVYQSALSSYALKTDIPSLDGYATQEWVQQRGYLTSVNMDSVGIHSSWHDTLGSQMPDYATSGDLSTALAGYYTKTDIDVTLKKYVTSDGLTNVLSSYYTKEDVNDKLEGYVTLSTEQEIKAKKTFSAGLAGTDADFSGYVSASRLYVPFSGNNRKYFISVVTAPVGGEAPDEGLGIDEDELWTILGTYGTQQIDPSHIPVIPVEKVSGLSTALSSYATQTWVEGKGYLTSVPKATSSAYGGIKIGYPESGKNYPVELDSSGRAYVSVPWVNTTYSLSSFDITATAAEINKLDGIDTLLHSGNYTSYTVTKTGGGASGTWPISISGNAATADISNYLFLNPNNGTHASQNDAVPANGRFAIYDVNAATTAGGNDGYIMAFRWPSGNFATQVFLDADDTGIMALRHRNNSNVWTDWYRILHSGNIGSYALTPSNYTSTLDSRYVNVYGDTMTGTLNISSSSEALIRYQISGSNKAASGYLTGTGAYLYSWPAGKYLHITDAGSLLFGGSTVWHSGNDGSGSGLDADLLDGLHSASLRYLSIYNPSSSGVLVRTDISSNANIMFSVHIWGNTYGGAARPIDSRLEFYSYAANDAMLEYSLQNNGCAISSVKVFCYNGYVYIWLPYIKIYMSYSVYVNTTNTDRDRNYAVEISSGGVPSGATRVVTVTPKNVALTTDNVASATKLANSRTLWGRPFDGTGNVSSGAISSTGNITPSAAGSYNIGTASLWYERIYGRYIDTASGYNLRLCTGGVEHLSIQASSGNVGIGTTSPAYKLDVAGSIRATSGITIGSTDDYGWYIYSSRICAGVGVARGVNAGSLLVSSAWADYTKVPTNGIYCKGDIWTGGRLYIPSSSGNNVFDAYIA